MNKHNSILTILLVGIVALGLLSSVALDSTTANVPKPPKKLIKPKIPPKVGAAIKPVVIDRGPDTVYVDDNDHLEEAAATDAYYARVASESALTIACANARVLGSMTDAELTRLGC